MLTLQQQQFIFAENVSKLIQWANAQGYKITLGEAWRTPEQAKLNADNKTGISESLHRYRLAIDLNLFLMGTWLKDSADHKPLGQYWKSLHDLNRWGGDFKDHLGRPKPDGNHYSMEYNGRK